MKIGEFSHIDLLETEQNRLRLDNLQPARIIAEHRGLYGVKDSEGEYSAKVKGRIIHTASSREDYPAVGDWVAIERTDNGKAVIHSIFPRKTVLRRKCIGKTEAQIIAANVDTALVVESVGRDYNLNRFERYFAIASDGGVNPAAILNKMDLISEEELGSKLSEIKERFGDVDVIPASTLADGGLDGLRKYIEKGKTYCFLGSSGVGKSSLINRLAGRESIRTGEIGSRSDRGKHVTTAREMYFLENGGIVIDNPGMREVGMVDTGTGIDNFFDEIKYIAQRCKFADCTHVHEPGCEVLAALRSGKLSKERYSSYVTLKKESEYYGMNEVEKREKDRRFGKFLKKAKKDLGNYGCKDYS